MATFQSSCLERSALPLTLLNKNTDIRQATRNPNALSLVDALNYWTESKNIVDILASFSLANRFSDCVGEVDVITDAENIKKLLQLPFNRRREISMMVHRIGKTILIDEFDIHSNILRLDNRNWKWLRDFFYRLHNHLKVLKNDNTRNPAVNTDLFLEFLLNSIDNKADIQKSLKPLPSEIQVLHKTSQIPDLEKADNAEEKPRFCKRSVLWNFENIKMLIASSLPIFGDDNHPAVSLRLRDVRRPITVLAALDYWLDNLICNVPELAICFHLDGIVQHYELLRTEEIPYLNGSSFSPNTVKEVATNIWSFLKSNATREGHTYWLLKGPNDDVVKLYDLTSLCASYDGENPYTQPLIMLLYRVATNLMKTKDGKVNYSSAIRTLLFHCLSMIDKVKYPELYCSMNYMMSELLIDDNITDQSLLQNTEELDNSNTLSDEEEEFSKGNFDGEACSELEIKTLTCRSKISTIEVSRLPAIHGSLHDRAKAAVKHVAQALEAHEVAQVCETVCDKKSVAIPLPFSTASGVKRFDPSSIHAKCLLLLKASSSYFCLGDSSMTTQKYGRAMRCFKISLMCHSARLKLLPECANDVLSKRLLSYILTACGDCHMNMAHSPEQSEIIIDQYRQTSDMDEYFEKFSSGILPLSEYAWIWDMTPLIEVNICHAIRCYNESIYVCTNSHEISDRTDTEKKRINSLKKRLANAYNEHGCYIMNVSEGLLCEKHDLEKIKTIKNNLEKSYHSLCSSIQLFESIEDAYNQALLQCNCAKLMRFYGQICPSYSENARRGEFSQQEEVYYEKAIGFYEKALEIIGSFKPKEELYEVVLWDLSCTHFSQAILFHEYPPCSFMSQEEIDRKCIGFMMKSLKYLNPDFYHSLKRKEVAKIRFATIHHRIASMYNNALRREGIGEHRFRQLRNLVDLHYDKAQKSYNPTVNIIELLRINLEKHSLAEFCLNQAVTFNARLKGQVAAISQLLCAQFSRVDAENMEEYTSLVKSWHKRLTSSLLHMIKLLSSSKKPTSAKTITQLKSIYHDALTMTIDKIASAQYADQIQRISEIVKTL